VGDRYVINKEAEKILKYKYLPIVTERIYMKSKIISDTK
jgi:hypothetical protein